MAPATKTIRMPIRRLEPRKTKPVSEKSTDSKPRPVAHSHFLNLPSELRNEVYTYLFPPNTRFETSQRMSDPDDERPPNYTRVSASRRHPVTVDDVEIKYFLGIHGTCKMIRQEATSILNHNLKGAFTIMIATDFRRIPPVILGLIDTATRSRPITFSTKYRYFLRFPNLKIANIVTLVTSKQQVIGNLTNLHQNIEKDAYKDLVAKHFNDTMSRNLIATANQLSYPTPFQTAFDHTPKRWKLLSGKCPAAIIVQVYVVDHTAMSGANAHEGLLVRFDYNHGRVDSVEEQMFTRLLDSNNLDPYGHVREWWCPDSWVMSEPQQASN